MKLKFAIVLGIALAIGGCTKQQANNVTGVVFTVEEVTCMVLNSGMFGDTNAVQELEIACKLSPAIEAAIQQFINNMAAHPEALAKLKAAGLRK